MLHREKKVVSLLLFLYLEQATLKVLEQAALKVLEIPLILFTLFLYRYRNLAEVPLAMINAIFHVRATHS